MDSIPLEMDNIFDDYDDVDDGIIATRLPDLDEMDIDIEPMTDRQGDDGENDGGADEDATDNPDLLARLQSMKGASKHTTKRTMPKLDATRLTGERGIPVLPKIFKDVPLKGKHHEVDDLKVIMHHLEHWAHRLFPKMPFSEVLDRVERLGAKKEVQTCVKRIRLGMTIWPTDVVDEDDDVQRVGNGGGNEDDDEERDDGPPNKRNFGPDEDEIEMMIQEQEEMERQSSQTYPPEVSFDTPAVTSSSQGQEKSVSSQPITEDIKSRIERNKRLAMEKRAARLAKASSQDADSQVISQASEDNSQASQVISQASQDNSQVSQVISQASQDNSQVSQVISQASQDNSQVSQVISQASQDNSQVSQVISQASQNNSQVSQVILQASQDNSQVSQPTSEASQDNSQVSASQASQDNSQVSQASSQASQDNSQASQVISQASQDNSQVSQPTSEASQDNSQVSASQASQDNSQVSASQASQDNSQVSQASSQASQDNSQISQKASEANLDTSHISQATSESSQVVSPASQNASQEPSHATQSSKALSQSQIKGKDNDTEAESELYIHTMPPAEDGQTFDSAIELLESADDVTDDARMELLMDLDRIPSSERTEDCKRDGAICDPDSKSERDGTVCDSDDENVACEDPTPMSQDSDEELSLSFSGITKS